MIVQKDFLNKLKDFGLNSYESKLWTALLSRGISTAGELSDIAGVPRSRTYDVLESLEKKGFIIMKLGKPIKYIAVPPADVLERVKKKIKEEADVQTSMLEQLRKSEVLSELQLLHAQGVEFVEPANLSGVLKGRNNVYHHLSSLINNAEKSVIITTTEAGLNRKQEHLLNVIEKANSRGVKVKIAVPNVDLDDDVAQRIAKSADVRILNKQMGRFCLVDDKEVTFMVMDDASVHPTYDIGIWINSPFMVNSLRIMFDSVWSGMKQHKR